MDSKNLLIRIFTSLFLILFLLIFIYYFEGYISFAILLIYSMIFYEIQCFFYEFRCFLNIFIAHASPRPPLAAPESTPPHDPSKKHLKPIKINGTSVVFGQPLIFRISALSPSQLRGAPKSSQELPRSCQELPGGS